ncbi:hypothetical protein [Kordiimonas sp. SCSIO 12610]|uniref:hypothetical protein n=1 Tax=Kordiimonas sp. SCSIO 12610 TaxID=2829597 RepID=UPI002108F056|nr:hypothetical protein [Kordiimonas sp. SCSIO 12610]UTW56584.1 hypothetical protein KFF44_06710 [Kordiimonas sp. SCSIO 12610]
MLANGLLLIFGLSAVAVIAHGFFKYMRHKALFNLLEKHVERGNELDVEVVQALTSGMSRRPGDHRKAIFLLILGTTSFLYSQMFDPGTLEFILLLEGGGLFAIVTGLGYLISLVVERISRKSDDNL